MSPENLSYLAGYIDGIDPFNITLTLRPIHNKFQRNRLRNTVRIQSEDPAIFQMLTYFYDCNVTKVKNKPCIILNNEKALQLCKDIEPYSFIHKSVCQLYIQSIEEKLNIQKYGSNQQHRNDRNLMLHNLIKEAIRNEYFISEYQPHLSSNLLPYYLAGLFDAGSSTMFKTSEKTITTIITIRSTKIIIPLIFQVVLKLKREIQQKKCQDNTSNILNLQSFEDLSGIVNYLEDFLYKNGKKFSILKELLVFKKIRAIPSIEQIKSLETIKIDDCPLRQCKKCRIVKPISKFRHREKQPNVIVFECLKCETQKQKNYYIENKENILQQVRNYKQSKRKTHSKIIPSSSRNHQPIEIKIKNNVIKRISRITKLLASPKILLGCSAKELKRYLESKFNNDISWENYGTYWHVDHIKPVSSFDLTKLEEQKQCCFYKNLRPLKAEDNLLKSNKIFFLT